MTNLHDYSTAVPWYFRAADPLAWLFFFTLTSLVGGGAFLCFVRRRRLRLHFEPSSHSPGVALSDSTSEKRLCRLGCLLVVLVSFVVSYFVTVGAFCLVVSSSESVFEFDNHRCPKPWTSDSSPKTQLSSALIGSSALTSSATKLKPDDACDFHFPDLHHNDSFVTVNATADVINVWRISGNESGVFQPLDLTLVFHHGSGTAMNFFVRDFERVAHLGVRVFAYDYPGFGRSSGTPTEDAIYAAARTVTRMAEVGKQPRQTLHFGYSMGGSVAAKMVGESGGAAPMILYNSIDSTSGRIRAYFPLTGWASSRFLTNHFDTLLNGLANFGGCLLFSYSSKDTWVPPDAQETMLKQADYDLHCSSVVVNGDCGHDCDPFTLPRLRLRFQDLLRKIANRTDSSF